MAADRTPSDGANHRVNGEISVRKSGGYRPRRRKLKVISVLLTALFPGLGHLYLKLFGKGIALIYFILIDGAALIYFSSVRMQINVPLLILLALLIPVVYFYSVYDVLQSTDSMNARRLGGRARAQSVGKRDIWRGIGLGAMLVGGGIVLVVLRQQPPWLGAWIQQYGAYTIAASFIAAGLFMFVGELRRKHKRTGRFTAALFTLIVGAVLVLDHIMNGDYMLLFLKWWPVLLIMLGLEYMILLLLRRGRTVPGRSLRLDTKGMVLAVLAAASIFAITEQDHYLHLWKRVSLDLTAAGMDFSEEQGYSVIKRPLLIPVKSGSTKLSVDGINGNITIAKGPVFEVQVQSKVYVDEVASDEAEKIAEGTNIAVSDGETIGISVKDTSYGSSGRRHPRMNLYITIPFNRNFILDVTTANGDVLVKNIASEKISLKTGNGKVVLKDIFGDISAKTLNGDMHVANIRGNVDADTKGGSMVASTIGGNTKLSTLVGDISVEGATGNIAVNTKNGDIAVYEALKKLSAESLNGQIVVKSNIVGGDWNVYSAVGELNITLPQFADYKLEGSSGYGGIETNLPFPVENKTLKGEWGTGEHQIKLDGNSNVIINKSSAHPMDPEPAKE
ncbi:DUF4097 family beta strand repeat-containing protein [Paenibacillus caui]|uniref:DUF4097 family beta strand repeat-containing protein n=1 Tax=Paenibacillus caui TaxID=2873927 RepID=UPI001CA83B9C|nr:DUF4097 family beta strand repeat-containing protein [Paenibacillus caui]